MHVVIVAAESGRYANEGMNPILLVTDFTDSPRHRIARHGADCPSTLRLDGSGGLSR
jgi:hypothetical protein